MSAIVAHRGFSGRQPEMTLAAYREAVRWSADTGIPLGLECDVQFSADDQLICLHDLTVNRTSRTMGRASELTVAQLKRLDFGSRLMPEATGEQCELVTLAELLDLVRDARDEGVAVHAVIESKHPNPRGGEVEVRVATMLAERGWDGPGSPVQVISFAAPALRRFAWLLPGVDRGFLLQTKLGSWADGHLPPGVRTVGVSIALLRTDPDFVARARAHGNQVTVWTVNDPDDAAFCRELGVAGMTTDYPDRVARVLSPA